ncbi:ESF1 homolog [Mytilus californianus]|uniref:ESF1 homolog n=1 Tax=Mytilus californianus TaxID=6549 RepID=UPI002245C1AA|nr:ESF1 homolog [Mytilus californianus]
MDEISKDSRFSQIKNDPKFRRMPRKEKKVKIDKRFKDMFSDKKFKLKYSVDKRGRPIQSTTDENFKKYYDISDSDDDEKEKEEEDDDEEDNGEESNKTPKKSSQKQKLKITLQQSSDVHEELEKSCNNDDHEELEKDSDNDEEDKEDESESDESGLGSGPDLARGEGNVETSSEEEESDEEEFDNDDNLVINIADLDKDAVEAPEITSRLAVCNLDWDRVKAQDIFVLLQSFKPTGGLIKYVKVYPSEFGIQRMEMEALKGPMELTETPLADQDSNDQDDEEGGGFHTEKLRRYQLNRLKYYYAVVECDSQETANKIYEECDNMEYESSSNKLDLRFIPEDMTFDHEPKTVCTEPPTSYTPSLYFTTALCQSKVDLTWDETDQDRLKVTMNPSIGKRTKKGKGEVKEEDFKAYLASSSEDEDDDKAGTLGNLDFGDEESESEDEEQQINKYKSLVQSIKESEEKKKKRDVEMEITWEPGLKESAEKIIKKKEKEKGMTVWDKYLEKKKEKKQTKRDDKKKQDKSKVVEEEDSESQSGEEAFSDDDVPEDLKSDPFFQHSDDEDNPKMKKKNKGKKKFKGKETQEEKELKEKQKAELSLLMMDEDNDEDDKKHFSLKKLVQNDSKKKKKKLQKGKLESKKDDQDEFKIDTKDPRFEALYTSHMYNVDPSAPEYKKTKGMKDIIDAKQIFRKTDNKRKSSQIDQNVIKTKTAKVNDDTRQTKDTSLQKLVESVKTKTKQFKNKK